MYFVGYREQTQSYFFVQLYEILKNKENFLNTVASTIWAMKKYLIPRGSVHITGLCSYYTLPLVTILEGTPSYFNKNS